MSNELIKTKYPNLFVRGECWYFRKYSGMKKHQFKKSLCKVTEINESRAYKLGIDEFNRWIGSPGIGRRASQNFRSFKFQAKEYFIHRNKDLKAGQVTKKRLKRHEGIYKKFLKDWFDHLKCEQVSTKLWDEKWKEKHTEVRNRYSEQLEKGLMSEQELQNKFPKFFDIRKTLVAILNFAKANGALLVVPKFKNPDPLSTKHTYIEKEKVLKILKSAGPQMKIHAALIYTAGMRPGEPLRYRLDQIEFVNPGREDMMAMISIEASQSKRRRSRSICIVGRLAAELYIYCEEAKKKSKYLFYSFKNPSMPKKSFKKAWKTALKKAGVGDFDLYCLRHTMLTDRANAGTDIHALAAYTDTSVSMIEKVYYKSRNSVMRRVAEKADSSIIENAYGDHA